MNEFQTTNKLKALLHRVDIKQLNAVYAGFAIGFINTNQEELSKIMIGDNKEKLNSLMSNTFYDLNEYAVLDKDKYFDITLKCIKVKFNTFKVPKFFITSKDSTFKDLLKTSEYLGGIEHDIEEHIALFKSSLKAYMVISGVIEERRRLADQEGKLKDGFGHGIGQGDSNNDKITEDTE